MPRSTSSEFTICGIAFGDTKAPTSTVCSPAASSASMNAMRSATPIGVFSFCRPSRWPTSTMRTESLMPISRGGRLDHGEFEAFADDIPDLALYRLQHAGKRRAQVLLHLHHFERQDRRALLQLGADFGQQCYDGARQRCHDLVFADLLLVVATERIDPMQVEPAVAGAQIQFMAVDHRNDMRFDAVKREIEAAGGVGRGCESHFTFADRQRRGAVAIVESDPLLGSLAVPKCKDPLPPANRHPARGSPWRRRLSARGLRLFAANGGHPRAAFEIVRRPGGGRQVPQVAFD